MNKLEYFIYNIVRKNPAIKQFIRNLYQGVFDLIPRKNDYFLQKYQFKEGFFFGFHDISPFSEDDTKLLANHSSFDLRMPKPNEGLDVGYFDLRKIEIGDFHKMEVSYAWNYHKGCRLQWINNHSFIFNTAIDGKLVSKIINIDTLQEHIVDYPIDAVYSDSMLATSFSYERLERCMPGYGYPYKDNGFISEAAPDKTGLFLIDLANNTSRLLIPLSNLANTVEQKFKNGYLHFITHSEFCPNGRYISFLHRWISESDNYMKRWTRIMVYDLETNGLIILPTQNSGSHYVWNHKNQLIASCIIDGQSCHVLFDMKDVDHYKIIAGNKLNSDGHQSFVSDTVFVTDTYPDKYRMAKIYMVDIETSDVKLLADVYSPKKFQTKDFKCHIACDLHPRISSSGKYISFDSSQSGKRALYVMRL